MAFRWLLWVLLGCCGGMFCVFLRKISYQVKLQISGLCLLLRQKAALLGISLCRCGATRWHCLQRFVLPHLDTEGRRDTKPSYSGFTSPNQLLLGLWHTFLFTVLKSRAPLKNRIYHQFSSSSYTKFSFKGIREIWPQTWYLQMLVWELSKHEECLWFYSISNGMHHPKNIAISSLTMSEHTIATKYNLNIFTPQSCKELHGGRK